MRTSPGKGFKSLVELSEKRANEVRKALAVAGFNLPESNVTKAETEAAAPPGASNADRAPDRKVVVYWEPA